MCSSLFGFGCVTPAFKMQVSIGFLSVALTVLVVVSVRDCIYLINIHYTAAYVLAICCPNGLCNWDDCVLYRCAGAILLHAYALVLVLALVLDIHIDIDIVVAKTTRFGGY